MNGPDPHRLLVVGASTGIGRSVVELAAASGARVAAAARREELLAELDAVPIVGDVRDEGDCQRIIDEAVASLGGLDGLVFSVGMSVLTPLGDATLDDWHHVFDANVFGAALITTAAAPHLIASHGRAVILSSKATRQPFPDLSLYTTSKIALDGLIACLRVEYPELHLCRLVVGNTTGTDFSTSWDGDRLEAAVEKWTAAGLLNDIALLEPAEVAEVVLFALGAPGLVDELAVVDPPPRANADG